MSLSYERKEAWKRGSIAVGITAALLVGWVAVGAPSRTETAFAATNNENHHPANKVAAAGSGLEWASTPIASGASTEFNTLLAATLKTTKVTDLLIGVSLECAIFTEISTIHNQMSEARATIKVWVTIDGQTVPVSTDDTLEPGKVVFCDRAHRQTVEGADDENLKISQYMRTRSANAFNWVKINVGQGVKTVEVHAEIQSEVLGEGAGQAHGAVGKRTLVIEPVHMPNSAEVTAFN